MLNRAGLAEATTAQLGRASSLERRTRSNAFNRFVESGIVMLMLIVAAAAMWWGGGVAVPGISSRSSLPRPQARAYKPQARALKPRARAHKPRARSRCRTKVGGPMWNRTSHSAR